MSTLLSGGMVTTAKQSRLAAVRTDNGRVVEIGDLTARPGEEVVDCSGCLVLPGGIETHSHLDLEAMGTVTADDFASGTRSALAGGTTTVLDFATQFHGESLMDGLRRWHKKARGQAVTDYGFHLAMTQWRPEFPDEMAEVVRAGVTSFKMYMAYRGSMMVEDDEIYAALTASSRLGATIGFHCENGLVIDALVRGELARGHTGAFYHQRTRPPALEREAAGRLTTIAGLLDAQHYIVHLSAGETLGEVRRARERGSTVVAETCPQYLLLDNSLYGTPGSHGTPGSDGPEIRQYVMSPPLRAAENLDALWAGLAGGDIQFVGTDHCSFNLHGQKDQGTDFTGIPNGAPGVELRLALLYTYGVAAGRISAERFVAVTAENAARYFGLYPRKGTLLPGSDADIVVYDP
ncbi:MAG TPA: dihydropyrimidinase, partial [Dermatophilaceae bacterium]